jgi:hypothetical protein
LIVENSPPRLWKAPVYAVHNGIGNAPAGCGWMVDICAATLAQNERDRALDAPGPEMPPEMGDYLSELLMVLKFVDSWVPRPFTAVMIAIAIPAAIRPYSMAVAPDSSVKNDLMIDFIAGSDLGLRSRNRGSPCSSFLGTYGNEYKAVLTDNTQLFRVAHHKVCSNLNEMPVSPGSNLTFLPVLQ